MHKKQNLNQPSTLCHWLCRQAKNCTKKILVYHAAIKQQSSSIKKQRQPVTVVSRKAEEIEIVADLSSPSDFSFSLKAVMSVIKKMEMLELLWTLLPGSIVVFCNNTTESGYVIYDLKVRSDSNIYKIVNKYAFGIYNGFMATCSKVI